MGFDLVGMCSQALAWLVFSFSPRERAPNALLFSRSSQWFRLTSPIGSFTLGCPNWRAIYPFEGEARHTSPTIRACYLQTALPFGLEPFLVCAFVT